MAAYIIVPPACRIGKSLDSIPTCGFACARTHAHDISLLTGNKTKDGHDATRAYVYIH